MCAYIYIMHILCITSRELQSDFVIQFNQTAHFTSLRDTCQDAVQRPTVIVCDTGSAVVIELDSG